MNVITVIQRPERPTDRSFEWSSNKWDNGNINFPKDCSHPACISGSNAPWCRDCDQTTPAVNIDSPIFLVAIILIAIIIGITKRYRGNMWLESPESVSDKDIQLTNKNKKQQ